MRVAYPLLRQRLLLHRPAVPAVAGAGLEDVILTGCDNLSRDNMSHSISLKLQIN